MTWPFLGDRSPPNVKNETDLKVTVGDQAQLLIPKPHLILKPQTFLFLARPPINCMMLHSSTRKLNRNKNHQISFHELLDTIIIVHINKWLSLGRGQFSSHTFVLPPLDSSSIPSLLKLCFDLGKDLIYVL